MKLKGNAGSGELAFTSSWKSFEEWVDILNPPPDTSGSKTLFVEI
jgi:hypothetical protein